MEDKRPRRRAAARSNLGAASKANSAGLPSAVHYVGYVEDDETPEMIMKKFEALERVKELNTAAARKKEEEAEEEDAPQEEVAKAEDEKQTDEPEQQELVVGTGAQLDLDENQLLEVFKQTSMFSVKSVQANNEIMMDVEDPFQDEEGYSPSDFELDEDEFWGEVKVKRRRSGVPRVKKERAPKKIVNVLNRDTGVYVQRKVRVIDETQPRLIRIPPPPLPLPWSRTVTPYRSRVYPQEPEVEECRVLSEPSIVQMDFKKVQSDKSFIGLVINPEWVSDPEETCPKKRLSTLQQLPIQKLCPTGFIFIWVDKRDVMPVCDLMEEMGYVYIENLTWIYMLPNNKVVLDKAQFIRSSHLTLYIFRKYNEGKDIELRHQRSPDVVMDCMVASEGGPTKVPREVYKSIDTLLPSGHGRLLELWSRAGCPRKGWTQVIEA